MLKPLALAAVLMFLVACGSDEPNVGSGSEATGSGAAGDFDEPIPADVEAYPILVSSEIVAGDNRFLVGVLNGEDAPIGSLQIDVEADFFFLESSDTESVTSARFDFIETVPGERGLYVGHVTFDEPGSWGAEVSITGDGIDERLKVAFEVLETGSTPQIGERPPALDTPTGDDVKKLSTITTDAHPDPDFYELSIADALQEPRPFVVVFATPKFCSSAVCGPTLDIVKDVAPDFPKINFLHVEVYTNLDDPSDLKVVPAVKKWGLPTEPWVFVVDERGRVAAKYEGTVAASELEGELKGL
ncbi:MAG: hypothetical protein M3277_01245 [Actinomycetota bacterium]|nr:hypothetical protein [Actinomycetota bacterium]